MGSPSSYGVCVCTYMYRLRSSPSKEQRHVHEILNVNLPMNFSLRHCRVPRIDVFFVRSIFEMHHVSMVYFSSSSSSFSTVISASVHTLTRDDKNSFTFFSFSTFLLYIFTLHSLSLSLSLTVCTFEKPVLFSSAIASHETLTPSHQKLNSDSLALECQKGGRSGKRTYKHCSYYSSHCCYFYVSTTMEIKIDML